MGGTIKVKQLDYSSASEGAIVLFDGSGAEPIVRWSNQTSNAIQITTGTTLQRPSTSSGGMLRFNTDSNELEFYDGDEWKSVNSTPLIKVPVRVISTSNLNLSTAPSTIDGLTLSNGDRVLVNGQTNQTENGVYIFNGVGNSMSRSSDFDETGEAVAGTLVVVFDGATQEDTVWELASPDSPPIIGTSLIKFKKVSPEANTSLTYRQSFQQPDLTLNKITFTHNLNQDWCNVQIYDNNRRMIIPDEVESIDANNIEVTLTSFVNIQGTWNVVITG